MKDITDQFLRYREAVRHLWNTFYLRKIEKVSSFNDKWDIVDQFKEVNKLLLSGMILDELGDSACEVQSAVVPYDLVRILPTSKSEVPIMISRPSRDGNRYWD